MGKKRKLLRYGLAKVVEDAIKDIEAAKDDWADNTIAGFRGPWTEWMTLIEPGLRALLQRLPAKRPGDVSGNVARRVTPVALYISGMARVYRARRTAYPAPPAVAPTPPPAGLPPVPR